MGDTLVRLKVTIESYIYGYDVHYPGESEYGNAELVEFRVHVERDDAPEMFYKELVPRDHFRSLFDRAWERAKREIDAAIAVEKGGDKA